MEENKSNIEMLYLEIELLHRQAMDQLNKLAWQVEEELYKLALVGEYEVLGLVVNNDAE